jgi:hypothetical protein
MADTLTVDDVQAPDFIPCNAVHRDEPVCGCTLREGHEGDEHIAHRINFDVNPPVLVEIVRWKRDPP